jgi:predicted kinase
VIVDATFAAPSYRAEALAIGERAHVPVLFVECTASHDEIVRRLTARARRTDEISDAGVATYLRPTQRVRRAERDPTILPSRSRYGAGSRSSVGVNHRAAQEPRPRP